MKIKPLDFVIFALPLLLAAAVLLFLMSGGSGRAVISVDGRVVRTVELAAAADETIDLSLPYHNIIEIKNHKIGVVSADCGNRTCVHTGFISRAGQSIVCARSRLCILIEGTADYDALTGMIHVYR